MERIWKFVNTAKYSDHFNRMIFLVVHTFLWAVVGLLIWWMFHFFICHSLIWGICCAGYAGFFIGFLRGVFFLWKKF